jgi:O-antigen/teichoic acid export membrane protein
MSPSIGLQPSELQRRVLRGAAWSTLSSVLALPMAIGISVALARTLGPSEFARFAFLTFFVPLLTQITDAGISTATSRSVAQSFAAGDLAATRELLGKALGWHLLRLPLICALAVVVAHPPWPYAVAIVVGATLNDLASSAVFALNAESRVGTLAKVAFAASATSGAGAVTAAVLTGSGTIAWVGAFASVVVTVPCWILACNPQLRRAALRPRLPRLPASFWRFGLTALGAGLVWQLVFSRSEIVILQMLGREHALAVFALAYGISQRLTTPVDTMLGPLMLGLSALQSAHPERLRAGFDRALRLSVTAVAFLAAASLSAVTFLVPALYGNGYGGVGLAFTALALVSLVQSAAQPYSALAYAGGRPGVLMRAALVALVLDVAIALALVPFVGLWGAIAANVVGGLAAVVLTARLADAPGGLSASGVPVVRLIVLSAGSCLVAAGAGLAASSAGPVASAAVAAVTGTGAFVLGARLSGGLLRAGDMDAVARALPRRLGRASLAAGRLVRAAA